MTAAAPPPAHPQGPGGEPPFEAPWQAQAFALAVHLHARGLFTWPDWAQALGQALAAHPHDGYYTNWLRALEALLQQRLGVTPDVLARWREAWSAAAQATPHGQPIPAPHLRADGTQA